MSSRCKSCGQFNSEHGDVCDPRQLALYRRRQAQNANRRARHQAMLSAGMTRVRGSGGGTFYE